MSDQGDHSQLRYGPPQTGAQPPSPPQTRTQPPSSQPPSPQSSPPPRTPAPEASVGSTRHTSRVPAAAWPLIVLSVAAIAGALCGAGVTFASLTASGDKDGWAELGAVVMGLLAGLVAFGVSYVVGLVLAARRVFTRGARALPIALALGVPAVFGALVLVLSGAAKSLDADLAPSVGVLVTLAALAIGPLAFAWAGTVAGRRRLLVAVAVATALVVGACGVGIGVERARTSRIVAQLPLVLFEGRTAEAPFAGWRRDPFSSMWVSETRRSFTERGYGAYLKYVAPGGVVFVTMHTEVGPCVVTVTYACRVEGTVDSDELRTYTRVAQYGSYPRSSQFAVRVRADGSAVSVSALESGRALGTSPDVVLRSLVSVDRKTFERETGSALRLR